MTDALGGLSPEQFYAEYWQRTALFVESGANVKGFPLDAHDLAGLACEEDVEARLVRGRWPDGRWTLHHGPFHESVFSELPEHDWTLLVQDVEKHYPPLQRFLSAFSFVPSWRLDDLMISFAAEGGSVGPHVDQYDVFLVQLTGSRRWQVQADPDHRQLDDSPLDILATFTADQEWITRPGDVLYLPPGMAHFGVALEPGMTASVGMRAPLVSEWLHDIAQQLDEKPGAGPRYRDPGISPPLRHGEVDQQALERATALLSKSLGTPADQARSFASLMSRHGLIQRPVAPEHSVSLKDAETAEQEGRRWMRHPWTRLAWIEQGGRALLFACGERFECSVELANDLCGPDPGKIRMNRLGQQDRDALIRLWRSGHVLLHWPEN
ncbi:MAG: cupin domain-containing protein [Xanthomonadales bacterium]|nr:cupin domain-containing protein [Xanthomonadales bacterium]